MGNYDIFAQAVDRGFLDFDYRGRNLASLVRESSLFLLHGVTSQVLSPDRIAEIQRLILPNINQTFSIVLDPVAVEDATSAIIIADTGDETEGLGKRRIFIEASSYSDRAISRFAVVDDRRGEDVRGMKSLAAITWGMMSNLAFFMEDEHIRHTYEYDAGGLIQFCRDPRDGGDKQTGLVTNVQMAHKPRGIDIDITKSRPTLRPGAVLPDEDEIQTYLDAALVIRTSAANTLLAVQELSLQDLPLNWIVRKQPAKWLREDERTRAKRMLRAKTMVPRSDDRPKYVFMTPEEIRAYFSRGRTLGGEWEKGAHPRKEVKRTYKSDRYARSGLQGTSVIIPAVWIGPEEAVINSTHATVMLSL